MEMGAVVPVLKEVEEEDLRVRDGMVSRFCGRMDDGRVKGKQIAGKDIVACLSCFAQGHCLGTFNKGVMTLSSFRSSA